MLLQERIEELNSAILNITNNKVYVTGFLSQERLEDYYNKDIQCFFSNGIYNYEELNFCKIKDDALFVVLKDNILVKKYLYTVIFKDTLKFKDSNKKNISRTFKVRVSNFSDEYNLIIDNTSLLFESLEGLHKYLEEKYNYNLDIKGLR